MVTLKGTGIESIADIKGKSIALPSAGNTTYYQALAILEAYGLTEGDYRGTPMTFTKALNSSECRTGFGVCAWNKLPSRPVRISPTVTGP